MDFLCLFQVSDDTTRYLLGRSAFPGLLDLNWDTFFKDVIVVREPNFLLEIRRELTNAALQYKTLTYHIEIIEIKMLLDTGYTTSSVTG